MSPRPVGSAGSTEVNFTELESEPITVAARAQVQEQASQVEAWSGTQAHSAGDSMPAGITSSGSELAAQAAREAAERRVALESLGSLEGPLAKLARKYPDPISFLGNPQFKNKDVALGAFGEALHAEGFERAMATLSPSDVRASVEVQIKKAWPQSSPKETEQLKQYFMRQLCESLRERAAPQLQDLATRMMEGAAADFRKTAADSHKVQQLAARLTEMAHPLASTSDQAIIRDLRAGLGLDPDQPQVTPEGLTTALKQRAALLEEEAKKMKHHARNTLFRALVEQQVGPAFKQAAGIREGSMLAAQLEGVKKQGEAEADRITYAKYTAAFVVGAVTGGMGAVGVTSSTALGVGASSLMAAPGVLHAWEAVDTARASESAGTMKPGAGEEAHARAVIETAMTGVAVAGGAAAGKALHPLVQKASAGVQGLTHGLVELGAEISSHKATNSINAALSAKVDATGRNALHRVEP